jgi:hypothetical protein
VNIRERVRGMRTCDPLPNYLIQNRGGCLIVGLAPLHYVKHHIDIDEYHPKSGS